MIIMCFLFDVTATPADQRHFSAMQPTRECVSELTLVALRMHGPNVSSLQGLQWALYAIMLHVRAMVARRPHMLFRQNPA